MDRTTRPAAARISPALPPVLLACLLLLGLVLGLLPGSVAIAPAHAAEGAKGRAVVESRIIGHTVKRRPIRAWRLGDPTSPRKVVFLSTMHGNERGTARILLNLRDGAPITGADIWVIPYLNRDGYARNSRRNAHGVDLNRNFPVHWRRQGGAYYSGKRPRSEPETRALIRFLKRLRPDFVVSFHQPLYGVDTSYRRGRAFAVRLAEGLELPQRVFNCNSGCHGTMTQWFNKRLPGIALTVEYGRSVSRHQARVSGPTGLLSAVGARRVR